MGFAEDNEKVLKRARERRKCGLPYMLLIYTMWNQPAEKQKKMYLEK